MKTAVVMAVLGGVALVADSILATKVLQSQALEPGWFMHYWPLLTSGALLLITGANIRSAVENQRAVVAEHKQYVASELTKKADRETVTVHLENLSAGMNRIEQDLRDIRRRLDQPHDSVA